MTKKIGLLLLFAGSASLALAVPLPGPEIDPGSAVSALALLSGSVLIIRGSRKK